MQPLDCFDRNAAASHHLSLTKRFVGAALTFSREPSSITAAFGMAFIMKVLHRFEGDAATAIEGDVFATFQVGILVMLITPTDQT